MQKWKIPIFLYVICYTFLQDYFQEFYVYSYDSFQVEKVYTVKRLIVKHKTWCDNFLLSSSEYFLTRVHYLNLLTKGGLNKHFTFYVHENVHAVSRFS